MAKTKLFYDLADVIRFEEKGSLEKISLPGQLKITIVTLDNYTVDIDYSNDGGEITDIRKSGDSVIRDIQPWKFEEVKK